jgi:hypothetical protein
MPINLLVLNGRPRGITQRKLFDNHWKFCGTAIRRGDHGKASCPSGYNNSDKCCMRTAPGFAFDATGANICGTVLSPADLTYILSHRLSYTRGRYPSIPSSTSPVHSSTLGLRKRQGGHDAKNRTRVLVMDSGQAHENIHVSWA